MLISRRIPSASPSGFFQRFTPSDTATKYSLHFE
jgi:hypothetical protein